MRKYFSRLPDSQRIFWVSWKISVKTLNVLIYKSDKKKKRINISCAHKPLLLQSLNTSSSECLMRPFLYFKCLKDVSNLIKFNVPYTHNRGDRAVWIENIEHMVAYFTELNCKIRFCCIGNKKSDSISFNSKMFL